MQRSRRLAVCAPASAAIEALESCRAPPGSTAVARWRPSHQIASVQPGAQQHQLEVVAGLAAAHDVCVSAAPACAVPYGARRARPRLCEVDMSACRCKNVAGVVHVQDHGNVCWSVHRGRARVCARARACMCAAQALPGEPTHAGNGSPVPELQN